MKDLNLKQNNNNFSRLSGKSRIDNNEKGSAIVIALLIMVLLLGFVAFAITRTTSETIASSNDAAETRAFEASQASLEIMTRNFNKIFDYKLNPDPTDLSRIEGQLPPFFDNDYIIKQTIEKKLDTKQVVMTGRLFQGLSALRDEWELNTTSTDKTNGVEVALRRRFYNNRIPIFQFGIFYDDDLEFHPGPRFDFGGRVHTNGNLFLMAGTGLYFSSKVSTSGEVFTDVARNGSSWTNWDENVFIKNASGNYVQLSHGMGSVLQSPVNGTNVFAGNNDMPAAYQNSNWSRFQNSFQGNLLSNQKPLELPIRISNSINNATTDYIELVKRGKSVGDLYNNGTSVVPVTTATADNSITSTQRYYSAAGIRVSLADSKAKLPGCASGTGTNAVATACGIRLDGAASPGVGGSEPSSGQPRGYKPRAMTGSYQATELNGERFYIAGRQVWIKIEAVGVNPSTNVYETRDITEDILSLGVTEAAPLITGKFQITNPGNYYTSNIDSRSIIKLQRFIFGDVKVTATDTSYLTTDTWNSTDYNYVLASSTYTSEADTGFSDNSGHLRTASITRASNNTATRKIVPFPINMFDTREGLFNEDTSVFNRGTEYSGGKVPWNGVMSIIDIDVNNLKAFLDGNFNGMFPTGTPFAASAGHTLRNTDIPSANGWVLYISDRRGDYDFDGEYDMEDIYGNNDGILQPGEDLQIAGQPGFGTLQADYTNEAVRYSGISASQTPDIAAVLDHKFYRRGVRLINGETLPGNYDSVTPSNTKGFTVASENGVYVLGNYNAYAINSVGTPTPSTDYVPQNTSSHVPASIAGDAVTILSNSWSDARSFRYPFDLSNRRASETFVRFAMLAGKTQSSKLGTPNQGGGDPRLSGGVHNFKRFLENWGSVRLNYSGSLINLFNSHNNNGAFKCCNTVYSPPVRNWVFDTTFLDPDRLPPGTPFFQSIQLTGFQRLN